MKKLACGVDGERWRFFTVEGAESGVILGAGLLELDVIADDADDIRLLLEGVREIAGVRHYLSYQPSALSFQVERRADKVLQENCQLQTG